MPSTEADQHRPAGAVRPGALSALLEELVRTPASASEPSWRDVLRPGLLVGRFELVRELGRGGFGDVFALGAVLYRMLAGELSYAEGGAGASPGSRAAAALEVPELPALGELVGRLTGVALAQHALGPSWSGSRSTSPSPPSCAPTRGSRRCCGG